MTVPAAIMGVRGVLVSMASSAHHAIKAPGRQAAVTVDMSAAKAAHGYGYRILRTQHTHTHTQTTARGTVLP